MAGGWWGEYYQVADAVCTTIAGHSVKEAMVLQLENKYCICIGWFAQCVAVALHLGCTLRELLHKLWALWTQGSLPARAHG